MENISVKALARPESFSSCFIAEGLTWIQGELDDANTASRLIENTAAVIYCAGSVRGVSEEDFRQANITGVETILQAIEKSGNIKRFLLLSSLAARIPELSFYAASKRKGETTVQNLAGSNTNWSIIRPPAVYGPGDRELLPLFKWMRRGIALVPGGGGGRFSLIFVDDLTEAIFSWLKSETASGSCFELHDGKEQGYSWDDVQKIAVKLWRHPIFRLNIPKNLLDSMASFNLILARCTGRLPMLTPGKVKEICHSEWICDNTQFTLETKWQPRVLLEDGLKLTLA